MNTLPLITLLVLILNLFPYFANANEPIIVIENKQMRLVIGEDGTALSLSHKESKREFLYREVKIPAFSIAQERPYANELQLKYPANPMTFAANSVLSKGDSLVVGFEQLNIQAILKLKITENYIGFTLGKLIYLPQKFGDPLKTPIDEIVLLQLPVKNTQYFGEWLNVAWDSEYAVNLLGTDPFSRIDAVQCNGYHLMRARAETGIKTAGVGVALITAKTDNLLNCISRVEMDYGLPQGVESRRKKEYNYSYYETGDITPKNVDEHIFYAKRAGYRSIQIVWHAFASTIGHFPWKPEYPNGMKDLQFVIQKIKNAGMTAGAHFWFNKTMKKDLYVTPVPDYRLNLSRSFTLAAPLNKFSTDVVVEENPEGSMMDNDRRILKIGNELISYQGFTTERPYRFTGCQRGELNTTPAEFQPGFKFGILDVDTWPIWVRFDQRTGIQDEMAERIGKIYHEAGFQYCYFDGSEDIHPPYWFNASMAQLKVYNKLNPSPLFSEGALKSHFSWHILTRGNAFDIFAPEVVKDATRKHPLDEAEFLASDFTSINFGWMNYLAPSNKSIGMQPDMFEFICSKATAWNCPWSLEANLNELKKHPRTEDNLEIMRRWEDARLKNVFSPEQKESLKNPEKEHILLIDESGKFELQPCELIWDEPVNQNNQQISKSIHQHSLRALSFYRAGKLFIAFWNPSGKAQLGLNLDPDKVHLYKDLGKELQVTSTKEGVVLPLNDRHFLQVEMEKEKVLSAIKNAKIM